MNSFNSLGGSNLSSLQYSNVSFAYAESQPVLHQINFELCTNEIVGILGPNGSGKSTLLKLANGLLRPATGEVLLNGTDIIKRKTSHLAREIVLSFQFSRQQFFTSTVENELLVSLALHLEDKSERIIRLETILKQFYLEKLRNHHPYLLSGGEQRRLAMAIALTAPASFFLLDEPTANVDETALQLLLTKIKEMKNQGKGIMIVSHDIEFLLSLCNRLVILTNGEIRFIGTPLDVINFVKTERQQFLEIPEIYSFLQRLGRELSHDGLLEIYNTQNDLKAKIALISKVLEEKQIDT